MAEGDENTLPHALHPDYQVFVFISIAYFISKGKGLRGGEVLVHLIPWSVEWWQ